MAQSDNRFAEESNGDYLIGWLANDNTNNKKIKTYENM